MKDAKKRNMEKERIKKLEGRLDQETITSRKDPSFRGTGRNSGQRFQGRAFGDA